MGILDSLLNRATYTAKNALKKKANQAVSKALSKSETFTFAALPATVDELKAIPEAKLETPYQAAALTVLALCVYTKDSETGTAMLNFLKGPRPLVPREIQFIDDRLMDEKTYIPFSYFKGASPDNDYTPSDPLTITVSSNLHSFKEDNYATLYIESGGADSPRAITLRAKGGKTWYLWEQVLLLDIRKPKSQDAWA